jgi:hypothetical protein
MKRYSLSVAALLAFVIAVPSFAQEKAKAENGERPPETHKVITPLRVQVVFNEFEGEKKISSLPYTLLVNSDVNGPLASIRMGLRVPIHTAGSAIATTYVDMGTNIDGRAERQEDGRFLLGLSVERSSAYSPQGNLPDTKAISSDSPVVQQFRSQINLLIRDGQTIQSTVSTDPVTGRVIKVDVTVSIAK